MTAVDKLPGDLPYVDTERDEQIAEQSFENLELLLKAYRENEKSSDKLFADESCLSPKTVKIVKRIRQILGAEIAELDEKCRREDEKRRELAYAFFAHREFTLKFQKMAVSSGRHYEKLDVERKQKNLQLIKLVHNPKKPAVSALEQKIPKWSFSYSLAELDMKYVNLPPAFDDDELEKELRNFPPVPVQTTEQCVAMLRTSECVPQVTTPNEMIASEPQAVPEKQRKRNQGQRNRERKRALEAASIVECNVAVPTIAPPSVGQSSAPIPSEERTDNQVHSDYVILKKANLIYQRLQNATTFKTGRKSLQIINSLGKRHQLWEVEEQSEKIKRQLFCKINNAQCEILIDFSEPYTTMHPALWRSLTLYNKDYMDRMDTKKKMKAARKSDAVKHSAEEPKPSLGSAIIISIQNIEMLVPIEIMATLRNEKHLVLGLDALRNLECTVDLMAGTLTFGRHGVSIELFD